MDAIVHTIHIETATSSLVPRPLLYSVAQKYGRGPGICHYMWEGTNLKNGCVSLQETLFQW